jgi:hypothetical protein
VTYLGTALVTVAWLIAFAFVATSATVGLRGGPLRLPFRGGGGSLTLAGKPARVAGVLYLALALLMLALPLLVAFRLAGT